MIEFEWKSLVAPCVCCSRILRHSAGKSELRRRRSPDSESGLSDREIYSFFIGSALKLQPAQINLDPTQPDVESNQIRGKSWLEDLRSEIRDSRSELPDSGGRCNRMKKQRADCLSLLFLLDSPRAEKKQHTSEGLHSNCARKKQQASSLPAADRNSAFRSSLASSLRVRFLPLALALALAFQFDSIRVSSPGSPLDSARFNSVLLDSIQFAFVPLSIRHCLFPTPFPFGCLLFLLNCAAWLNGPLAG